MRVYVFAYLLAAVCQAFAANQAVVEINAQGISGTITFTEVGESSVRVDTDLKGLLGDHAWHVHKLPVDLTVDPSVQCLSSWVGSHYDPTDARSNPNYATECSTSSPENCEYGDLVGRLGRLPISGKLTATDSTGNLDLEGLYSIVGHSIAIHHPVTGINYVCGTIRYKEELEGAVVTILQSIFVSPVAGRMYFRQVEGHRDVQIWGKLYHLDDSADTFNHNWHVHESLPVEAYRTGSCSEAGPHYNPEEADTTSEGYSDRCSPQTPKGCEIGDVTGKLATIDVAAQPYEYSEKSFFFTDSYLNLTGTYPIVNRSVVVHVAERGGPRLSCAPLVEAETLFLAAVSSGGSYVLANVSQYSRYQKTDVSLGYLPSLGIPSSLGSDNPDLTIVTAPFNPNTPCPLDGGSTPSSDSTYSPYTPVPGVSTLDGYALGDLSNAYSNEIKQCNSFSTSNLPLFGGVNTISGRTLRYTYGNRRECSSLRPIHTASGTNAVRARAVFSGRDIEGAIYFYQERESDVVTGSTQIRVDISYSADRAQTEGHKWHIHMNPSIDGQVCAGTIGGHYNPFSVSLANTDDDMEASSYSNYSTDCSGSYELRCESGDLSGKHGKLRIGSASANDRPAFTVVDSNLELGGAYSILGRSVGLHLPSSDGGSLFDCATITTFTMSKQQIVSSVSDRLFPNRVAFAKALSEGISSDSNIMVINQKVDGGCVRTTIAVLGADQATADSYAELVAEKVETNYNNCKSSENDEDVGQCPLVAGATHLTLHSLSLLLLLLLLSTSL